MKIKSKKDLNLFLRLDAEALRKKTNFKSRVKQVISPDPIWQFQCCLRHLEYYTNVKSFWNLPIWLWYKIKYKHLSIKLNYTIPINVIGPGLSIAHYGTIVISENAKIGRFCRIHACTNIGASKGNQEAPILGNNIYIGPGAIIYGNIMIADNVTIGANSTVNKSCEIKNVIIAGTPAKIVRNDFPEWTTLHNISK